MKRWVECAILMAVFLLLITPAGAQESNPIEDNSFLVEEAYNQEPGVVQHIGTYERNDDTDFWEFTFTQEWPLFRQEHQIGFTVPALDPGRGVAGEAGLGDVLLNYRYQAMGIGGGDVAFAPRISLALPTGKAEDGLGTEALGIEVNLPLSWTLSDRFVTHSNVGFTMVDSAENEDGFEADTLSYHAGQSLIWLTQPTFNVMLEALWTSEEEITGEGDTDRGSSFFLSPGFRKAFNLPSGLQIVPGVAIPIGLGSSRGEETLFFYLSFEHGFGSRSRS